jgi:hypothetical protein
MKFGIIYYVGDVPKKVGIGLQGAASQIGEI